MACRTAPLLGIKMAAGGGAGADAGTWIRGKRPVKPRNCIF